MTNQEKYVDAFVKALELPIEQVTKELAYQEIENWDSIAHMGLIAELEDTFNIMFEMDDIIDFSSYEKGIEILKKYDITVE